MPTGGRTRLKKLRFLLILFAVLLLGLISFAFGMFMAIASDLPSLENRAEYNNARNSVLLDDLGRPLGVLSHQNQILVTPKQIPRIVKDAVISIEDKRFETNSGIDIRAIGRAFVQDIVHSGAVQGASTIEQQFVKNALQAQSHRTLFEKLREAALAYQLAHKWSKEKIITEYLNTIYFGNGAYGIESAARTYFGRDVNHLGCGTPGHELCVQQLDPAEAALLAGIIQSPSGYNPVVYPEQAMARRNLVLKQMLEQGYLNTAQYEEAIAQGLFDSIMASGDGKSPKTALWVVSRHEEEMVFAVAGLNGKGQGTLKTDHGLVDKFIVTDAKTGKSAPMYFNVSAMAASGAVTAKPSDKQ